MMTESNKLFKASGSIQALYDLMIWLSRNGSTFRRMSTSDAITYIEDHIMEMAKEYDRTCDENDG